mgnify:CR=1 FL=1
MQLYELASLLPGSRIMGNPNVAITGISYDSRTVKPGDLFVCLSGHRHDGHDYAAQAVENGAAALLVEKEVHLSVPTWFVADTRFAMAVASAHFYRYPSHELTLIGITGTNGKTTTAHLIEQMLEDAGYNCGLIGTIGMKVGTRHTSLLNTTPDALDLQRGLRAMVDAGEQYCAMEVSSHALSIGRVKGCDFRTAVFTNLSQDHLDYHETMERYREAKGLFFSRLGNTFSPDPAKRKYAVLNADDPASEYFRSVTAAQVITYGIDQEADVCADRLETSISGTRFRLRSFAGETEIMMKMHGRFSVYNALAAATACLLEQVPLDSIKRTLEQVKGVPGRFEAVDEGQDFLVIVDYAHTPDSLENVLKTIAGFAEGRIICVFGCGGDRDSSKRPIMGRIAAQYSDYVIITSDNPRSEDPERIMKDIEAGVLKARGVGAEFALITDRREAIYKAVEMASRKDVVLIAGKGHETYQEINGERFDFDDRKVAATAIRSIKR